MKLWLTFDGRNRELYVSPGAPTWDGTIHKPEEPCDWFTLEPDEFAHIPLQPGECVEVRLVPVKETVTLTRADAGIMPPDLM